MTPSLGRAKRRPLFARRGAFLLLASLGLLAAAAAFAADAPAPFGEGVAYRHLVDPEGAHPKLAGILNPRDVVWVLAQLHLLFAAFVLAVPMFAVLIEIIGIFSKDKAQAARYDDLAHEFTRLLTTAFSATSIVGAIFTFTCLGLYPRLFNFLVDVFGPSMYLYACIFFGESFSLYLYYYGWSYFRKGTHALLGILLNVFGVTLMLIANAWTTFMMAPDGLDASGAVISRWDAFFNFLLNPINIHRLIANLCLGGSVAAAYAAWRFLSTSDPEKRAHYDWMGYIGNFIAILALLPLPFAGYYLGYEIYQFNQQLGITMMGGNLSWLFIMQAVLIGVLFLAANYYLWLGMDRIEGSERYRGWIKWLLVVIAAGVMVWATPKSLVLTSSEIAAMKGTAHPILSILGVMSAKNTAVNLIILATFLSFILYRRGNKVPTVAWAPLGKAVQAAAFGLATAVVVFIGYGGYVPSLWLDSAKRVAMSPWQVVAVLACMAVVMPVDVLMFRGAREIGRIRWGQVSARSQYTLILLAVSFTWLMGLMGFVRSALRQHWHVYEVMKDESAWAYTPDLGYATTVVTVTVMIFFAMVSLIFWISNLGAAAAHGPAHGVAAAGALPGALEAPAPRRLPLPLVAAGLALGVAGLLYVVARGQAPPALGVPAWAAEVEDADAGTAARLREYGQVDAAKGRYRIPVERAMAEVVADASLLDAKPVPVVLGGSPEEKGRQAFTITYPCAGCHSLDGSPLAGPTLKGRFGGSVELADGTSATFDEAYLRESITNPLARTSKGFLPLMPPLPMPPEDVDALVAFIKSIP